MATPEIREFSLDYEVGRLKKMLLLPITNVVFDERYEYGKLYLDDNMDHIMINAQLYINDDLIGTIPYASDRWGPMYDTGKQDELEWDKIYLQFKDVILEKIYQQEPLAATFEIKKHSSLCIGIKDKEGTVIGTAYCDYINDEWNVVVVDPSAVTKVIVTTVNLYPPPANPNL